MRSPEFWQTDGLVGRLLDPLGRLYGFAGGLRRRLVQPWRAPVPVLCIGNLSVGGTGKTPLAITVARRAAALGGRPHILSRGYRGRARGPLLVDPAVHDAAAVGDEPLLLARAAPTWVARDRRLAARAASAAGAGLLIMDDGFQNPTMHQDFAFVVVDGPAGFGNRRLFPAGPLREPLEHGVARAGAVVIVGEDRSGVAADLPPGLPVLRAHLRAVEAAALAGRAALAFAGIGRPGKFYETLEEAGIRVVERHDFPDHHRYRPDQLLELVDRADARGAIPLTTAKDLVRIPRPLRPRFHVLEIELLVEPSGLLDRLLEATFRSPPITSS